MILDSRFLPIPCRVWGHAQCQCWTCCSIDWTSPDRCSPGLALQRESAWRPTSCGLEECLKDAGHLTHSQLLTNIFVSELRSNNRLLPDRNNNFRSKIHWNGSSAKYQPSYLRLRRIEIRLRSHKDKGHKFMLWQTFMRYTEVILVCPLMFLGKT